MTFMVVDTDSYDVLLGPDFLIKIGAIMDVERGLIQVKHGPGANMEETDQDRAIMIKDDAATTSDSDTGIDGSEHGESVSNPLRQIDHEDEFGDNELEKLVTSEGPPEIL
ncbi:unnamed protein product [Sphagnum tenellum]